MENGKKATSLFDNIDLQMINIIMQYYNANNKLKGISVLDLANKIKINHNSLKPHLNKLISVGIIIPFRDSDDKVMLSVKNTLKEIISIEDFNNNDEYNDFLQEVYGLDGFINMSRRLETYKKQEEIGKTPKIDLRKKKNRKTNEWDILSKIIEKDLLKLNKEKK